MLSIVIPIHNEEPSILPLYDGLTKVLEEVGKPYEIGRASCWERV